ncbi:MAG: nucleotidyltransferase family protein [Methanobacterium sp.]|jgi:hypothetical protein
MVLHLKLKKEDELLIYLVQTSLNHETEIEVKNLFENGVDMDYLFAKASYHGLSPLVYCSLKNYQDNLTENVWRSWEDNFFRNTQKNLLFMGELLKLLQIFNKNNIIVIPYKGPIMALYSYGHLSLREFRDLDIYINKSDFYNVKKILVNENYETVLNLDSSKEEEYMKSQREYKFKNKYNGLNLEIHWNVAGFSFSFPYESSFPISKNLFKIISINDQEIKMFSDEDLLLILSLHSAGHLWSRLLWVCDIAELIKGSEGMDWDQIIEKAKYLAIERILYLNLSLSQIIFNLKLPKKVQNCIKDETQVEILEEQVLNLIFNSENVNIFSKVKLRFNMRENKINGFKDIIRILITPRSSEWNSFQENIPIKLLYILKRPVQIIKRLKE